MRDYRHPLIDHTFKIKDISPFEIEIDGIKIHRNDCDWMVRTSNHCQSKNDKTIHDLSLPFLQHILSISKINH